MKKSKKSPESRQQQSISGGDQDGSDAVRELGLDALPGGGAQLARAFDPGFGALSCGVAFVVHPVALPLCARKAQTHSRKRVGAELLQGAPPRP